MTVIELHARRSVTMIKGMKEMAADLVSLASPGESKWEMVIDRVHNVLVGQNMRNYYEQPAQASFRIGIRQTRAQQIDEVGFDEILILQVDVVARI